LQAEAGEHALARLAALPVADVEQAGHPTQKARLVVVPRAVGIGDLGIIAAVLDRAGEAVPLDAFGRQAERQMSMSTRVTVMSGLGQEATKADASNRVRSLPFSRQFGEWGTAATS